MLTSGFHWLVDVLHKVTLIRLLLVVATLAILCALFLPEADWSGSGDIELPVRVVVLDAESSRPIEGATVAIVYAPGENLDTDRQQLEDDLSLTNLENWPNDSKDATGTAIIEICVFTVVSNKHPSLANTGSHWVVVSAEGYGAVTTPLRDEWTPTRSLREAGELLVRIGLYPDHAIGD